MNQWVVVPVTGLILGQWYFIAQGAIVKATYVDGTGCVLSSIRIPYTAASFIYAVSINVIIGLLALWKLIRSKEITPTFSYLMFNDGLLFYILV